MEKNHQIQTLFNGIEVPLNDLEHLLSIQQLAKSLIRYEVLNFSLCIPNMFNVMINTDGYVLIAYHPGYGYDYHRAPIVITINQQGLEELQLGSDLNLFTYLEMIVAGLQSPLNLLQVEEVIVDGYEAVKVTQEDLGLGKKQSTYFWLVNQSLIQVNLLFNEPYELSRELNQLIIQSFQMNGTKMKEDFQTKRLLKELEQWFGETQTTQGNLSKQEGHEILDEGEDDEGSSNSQSFSSSIQIVWNPYQTEWQESNSPEGLDEEMDSSYSSSINKRFSLNEWLKLVEQMSSQFDQQQSVGPTDDSSEK